MNANQNNTTELFQLFKKALTFLNPFKSEKEESIKVNINQTEETFEFPATDSRIIKRKINGNLLSPEMQIFFRMKEMRYESITETRSTIEFTVHINFLNTENHDGN